MSERMTMKTTNGRTRWVWEKLIGHERNEPLDCRNYAMAALRVLDPDMDAVERRIKGLGAQPANSPAAERRQRRRGAQKRSYGDDW